MTSLGLMDCVFSLKEDFARDLSNLYEEDHLELGALDCKISWDARLFCRSVIAVIEIVVK